jgi:hypothetical protein
MFSTQVRHVILGKAVSCKGWQLYNEYNADYKDVYINEVRLFEHSSGQVFTGTANDLCKNYELSNGNVSKIVRGLRTHHKGWRYLGTTQERKLQQAGAQARSNMELEMLKHNLSNNSTALSK